MHLLMTALRSLLRPLRILAGKFVILPLGSTETPIFLKAASMTSADQVEGDYLEFGVYGGNSFIRAYQIIKHAYETRYTDVEGIHSPEYRTRVKQLWGKMRFFAFDSLQNVRSRSVDTEKVIAIPGWFADTCTAETIRKLGMKSASIIHIDCDLYESAKVVLKFIEPLLVDGTVLVFDDWYCFRGNPNLGEQRAFREWSRSLKGWVFTEYQKEGPIRNSFIASREL
jgi:hypothetical protein